MFSVVVCKVLHRQVLIPFLSILVLAVVAALTFSTVTDAKSVTARELLKDKVIAIDPGHGGVDPGAVGVSGALEKDVNLAISLKLQRYLEHYGVKVVMTRTEDLDYSETKREDLNARAALVEKANADIFVGIQCNAIPDTACYGPQVFYYPHSECGEILAKEIQAALWESTAQTKKREAQTISSPYILYTLTVPAVIVEAGFLSNAEEEALLLTEEYQKKTAKGIVKGIVGYYRSHSNV